ncbi:MAG: FAD-dependent oxidoreductase [Bacteroidota bacterium]
MNCIIIGASHAGVTCAFALRREGWEGEITLFDSDPQLPYHRPPLSKAYLTNPESMVQNVLKTSETYEKENINLQLGVRVQSIDRANKKVSLDNGETRAYDKLVLATGARPLIPLIEGIETAKNCFSMRTAQDAIDIQAAFQQIDDKRVVVIGGGYIGLETAASLRKLGAEVTILEREERLLARVTAPELSNYFQQLHEEQGVQIFTQKNVERIETSDEHNEVICSDGSCFEADMIIVGIGIRVNQELAAAAGLEIENGIKVNSVAQTSDEHIYAIGDCTFHHNPYYDKWLRLESVQNANDQAKIAAASICGKDVKYDSLPWFWSDQYEVKLQTVGLFNDYNYLIIREEIDRANCFSVWYFKEERLLAVDAINNGKAYMLGTKFLKNRAQLDKEKLADSTVPFKPNNFLKE